MARINLLPWRDQQREERKKQFLILLAAVVLLCGGIVFLMDQYIKGQIDGQVARNNYLQAENTKLDQRIKEISELKTRRKQLLARMRIIQDLQGNRPIIGRVFDQLVRTLPDGVYFTDVKMNGKQIDIAGAAESNNRVSDLMRNLDASPWLEAPSLTEVKAKTDAETDQTNLFQLSVRQTAPTVEEDDK
ncbi:MULTISPECIES: PilN domain-containing protein [Pseudomonas]|uniref:PilN domain-containing protein n=1 Tax=Pseudomonas quercus TaxID=2722792 RepID=A0ABX0YF68_9PSED|nr:MULTISPECIES: PilN domain-containing protein [Pseudomonas]MBF7142130.1 PilN domain-containing protein [Pseudomonas sp. LY10J]NJP00668.1 PilN domain-containing protein [Pseudomonas quercus]